MRQELLKLCRIFNGEDEFTGNPEYLRYWEAEQLYVMIEGTQQSSDNVKFYLDCGLASANLELPIELLACLFSLYCKGADNDPAILAIYFKRNFLPNYLLL